MLKELIDKRSERRRIGIEKEEMMKDIRLDNQLLIQECSNIRENLEDILKNINDIEKKFIELTNNNTFLADDDNVADIKGEIKKAKNTIMLHDVDKTKIAKVTNKDKLPLLSPDKKEKIGSDIGNVRILSAEALLKKQQMNSEEMQHQKEEVEKMQMKLKELVGDNDINTNVISNVGDNKVNEQSKAMSGVKRSINSNIASSRVMTIKTNKYYDVSQGDIKK